MTEERDRQSVRLRQRDYSREGSYFITLVVQDRDLLFSDPELKAVVDDVWRWLATQYVHIDLDEYVVMPNHLHGILVQASGADHRRIQDGFNETDQ
jgi:REP element-mobilizing transposase RayT